ncbi:hypothetical protein ACHAXR_009531 [Thalassiosira sp. AJA248-18]
MLSIYALLLLASAILCISTDAFANVYSSTNNKVRQRRNTKLDVEPVIIVGAVATAGAATWWLSSAGNREKQTQYAEWEAKEREHQEERERLAFIEPREIWKEEELKPYDGTSDETGPLLMAVKGDVFNVWKGRNFYGPGAEYNIMAGRDATRFLAKNRLEEESDDEKSVALNIAERANLEAWYWTIKNKYEIVGRLEEYDPKTTEM